MNPRLNALLDQLPNIDYERLRPHLQLVALMEGTQIYGPGDPIHKMIFPATALVAIGTVLGDGSAIDTAIIGSDGLLGLRGIDVGKSDHRFHVAASGLAYQIDRMELLRAAQSAPAIYRMCVQAGIQMIRKMSMEVACANFHSIEQRLAKWILLRQDQGYPASVRASHQSIAESLGVRREAVTHTLPKLRGIHYSRCSIDIASPALLEMSCCECYAAQKDVQPLQMNLAFLA